MADRCLLATCDCAECKARREDEAVFSCVFELRKIKELLDEEILTDDGWLVSWSGATDALAKYDKAFPKEAGNG